MTQILKLRQRVQLQPSGADCEVEQLLGGGGQGEVYRARAGTKTLALKWYFQTSATIRQRIALETLIKNGPPSNQFLWPLELATAGSGEAFGYVMPLREPRFKGIVDLMSGQADPTFRTLATVGMNLANGYLQLHSKGLCYRDISFGNAFFDPRTGEVLICDNDNVSVDGQEVIGVLGTQRFMAPEIVRGEAMPSTQTDLYSLAVLLFYILLVHHPLDGRKEAMVRCMDVPAMTKLYGTDPVFIYDPKDDSNRPVNGLHHNAIVYWPLYPEYLRRLFTRAFTDGLRDPNNGRVRESEWRSAMVALRDSVVNCGCGTENFYDFEVQKAGTTKPTACWSCGRPVEVSYYLRVGKSTVALTKDAKLYPHHLDEKRAFDFSRPLAEARRHPSDPNIWGLKNLSGEKWVSTTQEGKLSDVPPNKSVTIAPGVRIQFGKVEGVVEDMAARR